MKTFSKFVLKVETHGQETESFIVVEKIVSNGEWKIDSYGLTEKIDWEHPLLKNKNKIL
jgi:hypothetical protein